MQLPRRSAIHVFAWPCGGPSEDAWTDVDGAPIVPAAAEPGRRWRALGSDAHPTAALGYDVALEDDPELLDAVSTAVVLSFDRSRTDSDAELQASRRRIATASATERRRIERDLHDSAQQQLVALRIHLDRASERLGRDEELEQVGLGLEQALHEIRAIAHGAYPALLRDFGLGAALTEAARSDGRVRVKVGRLERYGEEVEAAVYFSALEALQNASKHCPADSRIAVEVWEDAGDVRFEVRDDGPGFDPSTAPEGGGLVGMRDRLAVAGGTVEIHSAPGHGTRVSGAVPARSTSAQTEMLTGDVAIQISVPRKTKQPSASVIVRSRTSVSLGLSPAKKSETEKRTTPRT